MKDRKNLQNSKALNLRGVTAITTATAAVAVGACAIGACAIGACAIGALAVRRMAIGRLVIEGANFKSVCIQDLTVACLHVAEGKENFPEAGSGNGIIVLPSKHSVDVTVEKLMGILQAKGVTLFTLIDHSGEAEKVGLKMLPTKLLIFGNPVTGTPVMLAVPGSAIDLPLKVLIWEDVQGKVWVTYNSPLYLQERHSLPAELLQNIGSVETFAAMAAQ